MRYALIMAGGSGTRLWPMSTKETPKQLIPFIQGRSLLQIAMERLEGLVPPERIYVIAGESTRRAMLDKLPGLTPDRFIGEPMGRDTLNAVGLGCSVIAAKDPDAVVAIFTADHLIEPEDTFRGVVDSGYAVAESVENALVTFGVEPTFPATGYGYLELGETIAGAAGAASGGGVRVVDRFQEKPDADTAGRYHAAGPGKYLWNSGMFVWKASVVMDCIRRYCPENYEPLKQLGDGWGTPAVMDSLAETFGGLKKISVDFAVMEPAGADETVTVAAVPMPVKWLDVGSWPSFKETLEPDTEGNAASGCQAIFHEAKGALVAGTDAKRLVAVLGLEDVVVIETPNSTLVCSAEAAQQIKAVHARVAQEFGDDYL
ncbi:MAG: sugar phosphate nucleotidyltransferase [Planctomycetota bacterium]